MKKAKLDFRGEEHDLTSLLREKGIVVIGKGNDADINLTKDLNLFQKFNYDSISVAGKHAIIFPLNEEIWMEYFSDVTINHEPLNDRVKLENGDEIRCGSFLEPVIYREITQYENQ